MKIIIDGTGEEKELSLINPRFGTDFVLDFIGNEGAFADGQFRHDKDLDVYRCSRATFEWWQEVVSDNQQLSDRIHALWLAHGGNVLADALEAVEGSTDLEYHAAAMNRALDNAFGASE